jgi:hypothetical protein
MLVIMKERGDSNETWGILKIHKDDQVEIVKHPTLPEGQTYHRSTLMHLIATTQTEMERKLENVR